MDRNSNFPPEDARRIANSKDAQQLMALLQKSNGDQLKVAMEQAPAGDYAQVQRTLADAMNNPQIRELLQRMGGQLGG